MPAKNVAPLDLEFADAALKALERLPKKVRRQIMGRIEALRLDPHPNGSKKLHGATAATGEPMYRERSGDFRLLYIERKNPGKLVVLNIGDRKDVYR